MLKPSDIAIVSGARTPMGRYCGKLRDFTAMELAAVAAKGAVERAIAHELTKTLGQTVAVENRPGAGGNLGGEAAAKSAPDGYTLFMTTSGIQAINPALYAKMNFDPNRELAPVAPLEIGRAHV